MIASRVALIAVLAASAAPASADEIADFYRGKTITMTVGSPAGGGYDVYARLLARHIGKHIPGTPAVVTQNRPGGASVNAANYVYNVAPQDGTVILAPNRTAPMVQLLGQQGPRYEATKFHWLGSLNNEAGVLEVSLKAPVKTVEDARSTQITVGVTTVGSDGDVYPALMNNTLGTRFKLVRGYPGSAAIDLAIERGEVEGQSDSFSSMAKHYPDWRAKIRALVQFTLTKHPEMPDVPLIFDYIKPQFITPGMAIGDVETFWRIMLIQKATGRPFAVGPGVPAERVAALRAAFKAVLADAEFQAEAKRAKMEVHAVDGAEVQASLGKISAAPRAVIDRLNDAVTYRGP